ncbi:putative outer membrane protein [Arcticibacter svalbardensis MN12-7]|uniref:Putative outer membrane protein n=1 Tax=Arcticibacter svalbardensis MN12-7 TaxID=1150600 RepID=R9GWI4_9SPHI|nr:RagB/SusD family nutrient uptake outer membrane protein [Arcticibacter svalbardensis]EOR96111.1 putative outer membrane protein [Arcticibacter svalbardensis MN12-7]
MKKKFILLLSIGVMLNYSCQKDLLYPESQTQVTSDEAYLPFTTVPRIQAQVLGLYGGLRNGGFLGGRYQVYNEIKADNWINQSTNGVTGSSTWNESVGTTTDEVQNLWRIAYGVINNCNLFIDGMAAKGSTVVTAAQNTNYVAEAKFIRGLSYYCLLQMYARPFIDGNGSKPGLPLRLTGNSTVGNYDLARSTVAEVYAQILADLNAAEAGLPTTYADATTIASRAHVNTAIALKTRVYLAMQNYASVITEANKIVSAAAPFTATTGVPFALQADIANVFKAPYNTTESVFSIPFNATETPGTQNQLGYYFYNNGAALSAEYYINPQGIAGNTGWKATDKRRTSLIGTSTNTARLGFQYLAKYATPTPYTDWAPVIRYSEVLLNLAEARVRSTNIVDPQAVALLNAVRNRSDATTTFTTASFATAAALNTAILTERNIEFLGEGLRNSDLMRLGLPIPAKSSIPAVPYEDSRYIWPIPGNELLYNKLITNN